jgi:hypothetical protein
LLTALRGAAAGDLAFGMALLAQVRARVASNPTPSALRDRFFLVSAELSRQAQDVAQAQDSLGQLSQPESPEGVAAVTRLALDRQHGDRDEMQRLLRMLVAQAQAAASGSQLDADTPRRQLDRQLLAGLAAFYADETIQAFTHLESALLAATPLLLRRPFLAQPTLLAPLLSRHLEHGTDVAEFAVDLLHRCSLHLMTPSRSALVEALTERELSVSHPLPNTLAMPTSPTPCCFP